MTQFTTSVNVPPLGEHVRDEVGNQLQATLVELIDLSLFGKQLHWCVVGPQFSPLHLQLDELVASWQQSGDLVAERATAIGYFPDGQSAVVAASAGEPVERGPIDDAEVVRVLTHRLAGVCERVRGRMDRLGELDAASQDVLIEVLRALEKQLWMTRAQLPHGGA